MQGRSSRAGLPVILATPISYRKWLSVVPMGVAVGSDTPDEAPAGRRGNP